MGKKVELSIVCITGVRIKRVEFGENVKAFSQGRRKLSVKQGVRI